MDFKLEIKKIFPEGSPARFNVAAWQKSDPKNIVLIGREVAEPVSETTPDLGRLVLFEIDEDNRIIHDRVLWESLFSSLYLEDPRALVHDDGKITIGLTALLRGDGRYYAFPALVRIQSGAAAWKGELPPICIIHAYGTGKNLTPVKENLFLFRPEKKEYHHKLLFFNLDDDDPSSTHDVNFPTDLDWALWRIGTTTPPVWIDKKNALLIIHGINIQDGKYIYSIGRARMYLDEGTYKVKVHKKPFITPHTFTENGKPMVKELHPKLRKVVYACGGIIKKQDSRHLYLFVNVGDTTTFEVKIVLSDLMRGLF